jgi:hypothetical protein
MGHPLGDTHINSHHNSHHSNLDQDSMDVESHRQLILKRLELVTTTFTSKHGFID